MRMYLFVRSLLRMSEANEVPINSHICHIDDIQTALKPLKKSEKIEINL